MVCLSVVGMIVTCLSCYVGVYDVCVSGLHDIRGVFGCCGGMWYA